MQRTQSGLSMVGFMIVMGLAALVVILGMKTIPAVIEYYTILKNVNAIARNGDQKQVSSGAITPPSSSSAK